MRVLCLCIVAFASLFFTSAVQGDGLRVRHAIGGQSVALEIGETAWYQSIGDRLVVLDKQGGDLLSTLKLTAYAGAAFCNDLLIDGDLLYALLDGRAVLTLDISTPQNPIVIKQQFASQLGIIPRELLMVGDTPIVFGERGAVNLRDDERIIHCDGTVTGVARVQDRSIVYAMDRRVYEARTNTYVGSASQLHQLEDQANAKLGTLIYTRELDGASEIGLMSPNIRDIDATHGTLVLQGTLEQVVIRGSRVLVATDMGVYVVGIAPSELRLLTTLQIEGVHDLGIIASNYIAVCGSFGYGVFRINTDSGGAGDTLFRAVSSTGALSAGNFDRHGVKIPEESGSMYYTFGKSVVHSEEPCKRVVVPTRTAVLGWEATIDTLTGDAFVRGADGTTYQLYLPSRAITVVPISGNFWFGTEDGMYVYGIDNENNLADLGGIQLAGPIVQLIPQFDGSAAFVTECGFVGVVEPSL